MPPRRDRNEGQITLEDHRIVFKNFKGAEGPFNSEGDRGFSVLLDDQKLVKQLEKDGWNVKYLKAREEGDEEQAYLQVAVSYKNFPPKIYMVSSRGRTLLGEKEVEVLDYADYETVDLIIRPYHWQVRDNHGIKAYVKSMYVTIQEDALDRKYGDIEDVPSRSGRTYD